MHRSRSFLFLTVSLVAHTALAQTTPQTQAYNADGVALQNSADLVAKDLGFTAPGEVTFALLNRGEVGINLSVRQANTRTGGAAARATDQPIKVDIFVGGVLSQSVYQPALAGKATKVFVVKLQSNVPRCLESRDLRVVIDQANAIAELHDDNNVAAITTARPCPDLAIKSIERDKEGLVGETYRTKVTVINLGNAPAPATQALATSLSTAPGITGWPEFGPNENIPALAPGQTHTFKVGGSVLSVDNSWVRVILDRYFKVDESDESNNRKDKKL